MHHTPLKALFYFLTAVFGLFGVLTVLRTIERLISGVGLMPAQLLFAIVALLSTGLCLKKATGAGPVHKG
jgi:hypothetical protein